MFILEMSPCSIDRSILGDLKVVWIKVITQKPLLTCGAPPSKGRAVKLAKDQSKTSKGYELALLMALQNVKNHL